MEEQQQGFKPILVKFKPSEKFNNGFSPVIGFQTYFSQIQTSI